MDLILVIISYIIPFVVLYYVVVAAVKRGIDQSEAGKILIEKKEQHTNK